ncbi:MAG: DNA polymerase III subunit gamma/tau, partial [Mycobacteriales bacterium]
VRDSLSLLDQLASGADTNGISYARAVALLGVTDNALLDQACDALAAVDGAALFATIDQVMQAGHDPRRFATDLLERLRDLLILDKVPDAVSKGIIDAPGDQLERMSTHALRLGGGTLSRMADIVHEGLAQMKGTTSGRLILELICARMLLPAVDDSAGGLLQRLERLERRAEIAAPAAIAPVATRVEAVEQRSEPPDTASMPAVSTEKSVEPAVSVEPVAASDERPESLEPKTAPAPQPIAGQIDIADVRRLWPELLERLKVRRVVWSLMQNATPVGVSGNELQLTVQHHGLVRRFADDSVAELIVETLYELLGVRWTLRAAAVDAPAGSAEPESEPDPESFSPGDAASVTIPAMPIPPPAVPAGTQPPAPPQSEPTAAAPSDVHALLHSSLGARVIAESDNSVS